MEIVVYLVMEKMLLDKFCKGLKVLRMLRDQGSEAGNKQIIVSFEKETIYVRYRYR